MKKKKRFRREKIGGSTYLNTTCWLVKTLRYSPSKRCQYCQLRFRHCVFSQYLLVSLAVISFLFTLSFLIEGEISKMATISIFVLIIVYGYFFNKSTRKIIVASFAQRQAKEALQELAGKLEEKVDLQTSHLKKQNLHLKKLLEMRSEFLDVASHQLRTPVSVIKNTLEMMFEGAFNGLSLARKKKYIRNAYEKSIKLQRITSDILMTSELDTVDFVVHNKTVRTVQLESLVSKAVADIRFEAENRKIILEWQPPKKALPPIKGYEQYLNQAIFNLIDNAVKYTPSTGENVENRTRRVKQGKVTVKIAVRAKGVVLTVQDNGIGIPKNEIKNLFQKFSRASNARDMYTDGTGLGLFIVKEIIEGHHGRVVVQSQFGKGTTFTIFLPIKNK